MFVQNWNSQPDPAVRYLSLGIASVQLHRGSCSQQPAVPITKAIAPQTPASVQLFLTSCSRHKLDTTDLTRLDQARDTVMGERFGEEETFDFNAIGK